jgi:exodeoxyribonuclease V alpha subunit
VAYTLGKMADEGHVYMPQGELVAKAAEILEVPPALVHQGVEALEEQDQIRREEIQYPCAGSGADSQMSAVREGLVDERAVYLRPFYYGEVGAASQLRRLLSHSESRLDVFRSLMWQVLLENPSDHVQLSERQREAVHTALTHKVTVLTGGPGTGKTTTVRTIIELLEQFKCSYALASPTGRAAKRLAETTGRSAQTVHRLLGFVPGEGFKRNQDNPLDADMLIVDEASMLDLLLTHHLLKAVHPASHLLLVGDTDQLPSVGAGNVLRDLIESTRMPVVRLDLIFRQARDSLIVANAHRVNKGRMPIISKGA